MNGKYGVLEYMKKRIEQNGICVVVVAEGAGQVFFYADRYLPCSALVANVIVALSSIPATGLSFNHYTSLYPRTYSDKIGNDGLQDLLEGVGGTDASGNPILGDFGKWFTGKVIAYATNQHFCYTNTVCNNDLRVG